MGETDIVDIEMTNGQLSNPLLMGLDLADRVNLLGHWMDQDRGEALARDPAHLAAMGIIASDIVQADNHVAAITAGANFALLTILREKWPVGSKAKFQHVRLVNNIIPICKSENWCYRAKWLFIHDHG